MGGAAHEKGHRIFDGAVAAPHVLIDDQVTTQPGPGTVPCLCHTLLLVCAVRALVHVPGIRKPVVLHIVGVTLCRDTQLGLEAVGGKACVEPRLIHSGQPLSNEIGFLSIHRAGEEPRPPTGAVSREQHEADNKHGDARRLPQRVHSSGIVAHSGEDARPGGAESRLIWSRPRLWKCLGDGRPPSLGAEWQVLRALPLQRRQAWP